MFNGLMEYLIALWAILIWKPLVKKIGESRAWVWAKRSFWIVIIGGASFALLINLIGISYFGPTQYLKDLSSIYNKSDEQRKRERQAYYKWRTNLKRDKIIQEMREKDEKEAKSQG